MDSDQLVMSGLNYLGTPYELNASSGRTNAFDCSSFIQRIFKENGFKLPRNSREQYRIGVFVKYKELKKGDLVFFTTSTRKQLSGIQKIGHVALYIGGHHLLHTYREGGQVTVTKLSEHWLKRYVGARRIKASSDGRS